MGSFSLTVVVPTHNPHPQRFERVLDALQSQTLPPQNWELVVIDNASLEPVTVPSLWFDQDIACRVIKETQLGLTAARWRGISEARSNLIVFVDDDNVLGSTYLEEVLSIFRIYPALGAAGGKAIPEYEEPPPTWFKEGMAPMGCRDLGDQKLTMESQSFEGQPAYPPFAPIGAGMALRRDAVLRWMASALSSPTTDRRGLSLSSAGDCDLVLHILSTGWDVGYFPSLTLTHLIPAWRVKPNYLNAISRAAFRDFIQVLDRHGIRPWKPIAGWSIPLRALKSWFTYKAWRGPKERLGWQGAIGQYEGRALMLR